MEKLKDVISKLESEYPITLKESWDNCGLMVGNLDSIVSKVLITLDVTDSVIDEAIKKETELIISHHPLIFKPLKNITTDTKLGEKIHKLIHNNISVYSMHTNLDIAEGGLNDYIFKLLNVKDIKKISDEEYGNEFVRYGKLDDEYSLDEFVCLVKKKLKLKNLSVISNKMSKKIKKVAVCTGSGGSFISVAQKLGVDCYITGDIKYHEALSCIEDNFTVIDAGHFGTEIIVMDLLQDFLKDKLRVEVLKSNKNTNPISIL